MALTEPDGYGSGGTSAGIFTGEAVLSDLLEAVPRLVNALFKWDQAKFDLKNWHKEWEDAQLKIGHS